MTVQAAGSRAGKLALEVYRQTLESVRGDHLIGSEVWLEEGVLHVDHLVFTLSEYQRVVIAGAGKASVAMAKGLEDILGDRITTGLVVTKYGHSEPLSYCRVIEAGHPVPDDQGLLAGAEILSLAKELGPEDLVLFALSGGASALMESLVDGIDLEDLQLVNRLLLESGATIDVINPIRSRLSKIKGGGLTRAFAGTTVVVLVMSDVAGDRLDVIGSGPLVLPNPTFDAVGAVRRLGLDKALPRPVLEIMGRRDPSPPVISRPPHFIIGNSKVLAEQAAEVAGDLGLPPRIITEMSGEARSFPARLSKYFEPNPRHNCFISTGETVVTKTGGGLGGRAQEMACVFAELLRGRDDIAVLVAGSDGTDGPTDAAGALVDGTTVDRAMEKGFTVAKALEDNDSYHFHDAAGTLIKTGPTGTNLNDILIVVRD